MQIRVFLSGRNYHAAEAIPEMLELDDDATVDDALAQLARLLSQEASLPGSCLVALSGVHLGTVAHHRAETLKEGDELTLIAPVAGG